MMRGKCHRARRATYHSRNGGGNKQAALSNLDHWQLEVDELFITQELTAGSEDGICETATSRSNP